MLSFFNTTVDILMPQTLVSAKIPWAINNVLKKNFTEQLHFWVFM